MDLEQLFCLDALQSPKTHRERGNIKKWGNPAVMDDGIPEDSFTWFFCINDGMIMHEVCMNPTQSTSCFETETS